MSLSYEFTLNAVQFMTVFSRIAGIFMGFPLFRGSVITMKMKLMILLAITVILLPSLPDAWSAQALLNHLSIMGLFTIILIDLLLGLTVSLAVFLMLEIAALAGFFISMNVGYSMSMQFDPNTESQNTSISVMLMQAFVLIFIITDMHLGFIKIAALSFKTMPPGHLFLSESHMISIVDISSSIFYYSFQLSLPIIAIMFLINVAMGIISRFGEDFQVLMLSFPIRLGVGLMLLVSLIPIINNYFVEYCGNIIDHLGNILGL
ncbi:MAG: flagellar biosynthetic protein FliR [Lentisphaerales bacterium]|nr:flagellar biosynthetic protein FliR [Lentisphaerales bacterium]